MLYSRASETVVKPGHRGTLCKKNIMPHRTGPTVALLCLLSSGAATGGEYVVNVPQLVGVHGAAPFTSVEIEQQLPTAFTQITSGSLRLTGQQFPGSITNFITGATGPVGAVVQLEGILSDPPYVPFTPFPYFWQELPSDLNEFRLEIPIGVAYQAIPDFAQWLDGYAEFTFSVGPPVTSGSLVSNALVRIDQAELVLNGQPVGVPEPSGASLVTAALAALALASVRPRRNRGRIKAELKGTAVIVSPRFLSLGRFRPFPAKRTSARPKFP